MSDIVTFPPRKQEPHIIAEWNIWMRMVPGGWEFELPPMAMTPNYVEDIVAAFRAAVEKAMQPETPA